MFRLISHLKAPPGEFRYEQTDGIQRKFPRTPLIRNLANQVLDFRRGNNLPRADFASVVEEIDAWNCRRLGNDPHWCYDSEKNYAATSPLLKKSGCSTCGHRPT